MRSSLVSLLLCAPLLACSGQRSSPLKVFAASSLTRVFEDLARELRAEGREIELQFAGSQTLAAQIHQGAPADLFASAHRRHLDGLEGAGLLRDAQVFAANQLVIAVPKANPFKVKSLADLAKVERLVLGAPGLPLGDYSQELLSRQPAPISAAIRSRVVSQEANAGLVLAKLSLGEVDASLSYASDLKGRPELLALPISAEAKQQPRYWLGLHRASPQEKEAAVFIERLKSPRGQALLVDHGFLGLP